APLGKGSAPGQPALAPAVRDRHLAVMASTDQADWNGALERARAHSPFLAKALERRPDLAGLLADGRGEEALVAARSETDDVGVALRRERLGLALGLAVG